MKPKYANLLSPVKVGNLMLKNRFISSNALPHFLQGPENYPGDQVIHHMASCAKNGAAVVTIGDWTNPDQRNSFNEDGRRFPMYDLSDPSVENYMCQMADQIHYYNSRISLAIMPFNAPYPDYDIYDMPEIKLPEIDPTNFMSSMGDLDFSVVMRNGRACKALTHEMIREIIETQAQRAKLYQSFGFDMVTLHFAYRATLLGRFISPITNKRTDEYGGPIENRSRFLLELCARIKELCGKGFPIEVQITAQEKGGTTLEDTIKLAKLAEGYVDIFQFRAGTGSLNHPTGYNSRQHEYVTLEDCAAVKASGTSILCEPLGGFQDLDDAEEIIASGKADLIGGARAFFVDPDYYTKVKEGRGEDVLPCVRCNKCHGTSLTGDWLSVCTVNPEIGIAHKLDNLVSPVTRKKKVAVAGGGPAGMRAALYCAARGHEVDLFEQSGALGGQLRIMDYPSFKWALAQYRDYLIRQLEKSPVKVSLNTMVTSKLIEAGNYDALIVAIGSQPKLPPIAGAEKCIDILSVFGHEAELGKRCVVIGGSESGTEAAMYLAENGHDTVLLTRQAILAPDATPIHYKEIMQEFYTELENFDPKLRSTATAVGDGYVDYTDTEGRTHRLECDSVVALGGMAPLHDEAMALHGIASETYVIGDCYEVGNIHTGARGAFAAAHQI